MFFGKIDENEFITVEKFIPGTFQKYINNDDTIVNGVETSTDGLKKVEAFVHYTFKKSEGNLIVLDIQGIGNVLCDPEIATEDIVDIDDEFLLCLGNLANNVIQEFLGAHECNAYCEAVNLPDKASCWNHVPFLRERKYFHHRTFFLSLYPTPLLFYFIQEYIKTQGNQPT